MELPQLNHPERLWWLLAIVPLWLLARPPRPQSAVLTAHLSAWIAALAAAGRRPKRFRRWRFVLLVVAASCGALAFAGAHAPDRDGKKRLVAVVDASASMAARDETGTSAYERALAALGEVLAAVPRQVDARVVFVGGDLDLRIGTAALASPPAPAGEPCVPLDDVVEAASMEDTAAVLWTDGQHGAPGLAWIVGRAADNWGITRVVREDRWPSADLLRVVTVESRAARAAEGRLAVAGPIVPIEPQVLRLDPGERKEIRLELRRAAGPGRLSISVDFPGDALALDDSVEEDLPPLPRPKIAVLAEDPIPRALTAAARSLAEDLGGSVTSPEDADFLLVEGGRMPLPKSFRGVSFGTLPPGGAAELWPSPEGADWDRQAPLLAGLDLSELEIRAAWRKALPAGKDLLFAASSGPGVLARSTPLAVHFAFRLADSNLALLPAFPQILRRALLLGIPEPPQGGGDLVPRAEGDLSRNRTGERPDLPEFARRGDSYGPLLLLAALACMALRAWIL
ncbi:MAG: hypothetical protein Fur0037_18020 [Planctomycetota bacterium]